MNIISIFKDKVGFLINDSNQEISEKLIELSTFFYKIDKRVSIAEMKYIDELLQTIEWESPISIESYQEGCISKVNRIIQSSEEQIFVYLGDLMQDISNLGAITKAKSLAKEISDAYGEIADDEIKYLELVMSFE